MEEGGAPCRLEQRALERGGVKGKKRCLSSEGPYKVRSWGKMGVGVGKRKGLFSEATGPIINLKMDKCSTLFPGVAGENLPSYLDVGFGFSHGKKKFTLGAGRRTEDKKGSTQGSGLETSFWDPVEVQTKRGPLPNAR